MQSVRDVTQQGQETSNNCESLPCFNCVIVHDLHYGIPVLCLLGTAELNKGVLSKL